MQSTSSLLSTTKLAVFVILSIIGIYAVTPREVSAYGMYGCFWNPASMSYDATTMSQGWQNSVTRSVSQWNNVANSAMLIFPSSTSSNKIKYGTTVDAIAFAETFTQPSKTYCQSHWGTKYSGGTSITFNNTWTWYTGIYTPASWVADAWSIGTHEFGHAIGFAHSTGAPCPGNAYNTSRATMCDYCEFGQTYWRSLEADDKNGAAYYY